MYHVLVKFAKALAPFIPFITEVMYQNLVRSVRPGAYESIHHTAWPKVDASITDDALLEQLSLARRVASLGSQCACECQPQGAPAAQQSAGVRR